jgi:hypothetical protein
MWRVANSCATLRSWAWNVVKQGSDPHERITFVLNNCMLYKHEYFDPL